TALGSERMTRLVVKRAQAAATMIALYAQSSMNRKGADPRQMATLRDQALKVVEAINDKKWDEAKKLAAGLGPAPKADDGAKVAPAPLEKAVELAVVMSQSSSTRVGGQGLEKALVDLEEKKKPFTNAEMEKLTPLAYKLAAIAELAEAHVPKAD